MIFPFYHAVSDDDLPYISNLYPLKSIDAFKAELDYFCQHFSPVSLDEIYQHLFSKTNTKKPIFHLSFDDGLREVYTIIAPILAEKGIPATFFINSDFVDNKNLFYRYKVGLLLDWIKNINDLTTIHTQELCLKDHARWIENLTISLNQLNYQDEGLIDELLRHSGLDIKPWLAKYRPYMNASQIQELRQEGFTIGAHSIDHPRFKNISIKEQKRQFVESTAFVEEQFGVRDRLFSFPFGDEAVSKEFFDWMYGEGKCQMSFGVSGIKDDYCPFHIHRIPMDECLGEPEKFIKSLYGWYMVKSIFNKNQIQRC